MVEEPTRWGCEVDASLYTHYMYEPGYRDDMENVLGMEPSCNCRTCGRFLPAKESDPYESLGYPSMTPVAHVDHSNRPCIGSPIARPWMYLQ
jgi:hypothetical protein